MFDAIFIFGAKYLIKFMQGFALIWFLLQNNLKKKDILIFSVFCLPLVIILAKFAGHLYYNPRPFVVGNFVPLIHHVANNGFPSHHTLLSFAIAGIVFVFSRGWGFAFLVLALWVGFSRIYVGVHHVIDVLASILISLGSVWLIYFFQKYLQNRKIRRN